MKELFPLKTFHQDAVLQRLKELYENEVDLDSKMPYDEDSDTYSIDGNFSVDGNAKIFENIVDKDGHNRFIEGDINIETITGVSKLYGKWSLSGTHLMIVLCLSLADTTALTNGQVFAFLPLAQWIMDKIVPVYARMVATELYNAYASDYTSQSFQTYLRKNDTGTSLEIVKNNNLTLDKDRTVRIAFDLLIDNE
ncbi:MAG: hypothetical protein J6T10_00915 [Methanobrevibacter sp.]|nr:hypothetical protein [Methanobrevibacter sp.]